MIKSDVKDFDELLDVKYGKRGTPEREKWENELESFKSEVLIESLNSKKIKFICNVL
jgi:HTH-type transcriptional regulator / antitoxin HipB